MQELNTSKTLSQTRRRLVYPGGRAIENDTDVASPDQIMGAPFRVSLPRRHTDVNYIGGGT